jgi:cell division protein ZapA
LSGAPVQVTIRILDKDYQVACPEDERAALVEAARLLNERMTEIRTSGKVVGADRIAVMAALNISHELLETRAGRGPGADAIGRRILVLQEKVEQALSHARQHEI